MEAENLATTGNRSPDCPARKESLYRLRYPGPLLFCKASHRYILRLTPGSLGRGGVASALLSVRSLALLPTFGFLFFFLILFWSVRWRSLIEALCYKP